VAYPSLNKLGCAPLFVGSVNSEQKRYELTPFGLDSLQSWIAAVESVVGIVIEGVFVAMPIQWFFGR
jgi:hypothetical protein